MGKNNKARRAAKAKQKAQARRAWAPGPSGPGDTSGRGRRGADAGGSSAPSGSGRHGGPSDDDLRDLFTGPEGGANVLRLSVDAHRSGQEPMLAEGLRQLVAMAAPLVDRQAELLFGQLVAQLWRSGWQPAELQRQGRMGSGTAAAGRLVGWAIAADHSDRPAATMGTRWLAQVDALDLPPLDARGGWLAQFFDHEHLPRADALAAVVDALANLAGLPSLDRVLPPPGSTDADTRRSAQPVGAEADPVLDRIRNLLAKAESTSYEAEATSLTAKAQELMTRHAVDAAVLHDDRHREERPVLVRVPIDPPYVDAKSLLLQTVAGAGRCRAVMVPRLAMSTVVGFADDVTAVEMLFTSLLVQAQTAVADAARRAPAGTRTRSQSYRSAFLLSYTHRIGDRLAEINEAVYAQVEAEQGGGFLPVLRSREGEVDDYMAEHFGDLSSSRVRGGHDAAGWAGGRVAADNARLGAGDLDDAEHTDRGSGGVDGSDAGIDRRLGLHAGRST